MLGEFQSLLSSDALCRDQIQKLEAELRVYKRAFVDVDGERQRLEAFKEEAEKQMGLMENQLKVGIPVHNCNAILMFIFTGSPYHYSYRWRRCNLY
jgi:hypothetical protein